LVGIFAGCNGGSDDGEDNDDNLVVHNQGVDNS
jgi:hypothetical protein